uniref:G protein-coupled receptor n=1 Tax=Panagrolaimus sp. JU765 TaxID=591449 RepID=A0AC34PYJ7_9BILA
MFAAFAYACWTVYTFWPNLPTWEIKAILLRADGIYREGIPNFVVASIDDWPLKVLFVYAYVLVGISYLLTIFFNVKVYHNLKSMENQMSVQAKDAHKQISTILIVQAAVPGVICLFPIALAVTLAFLHTNIPNIGLCIGLMFSVIPLANPLLTLIVVRNYRNAVLNRIKTIIPCIWICKKLMKQPISIPVHPIHQSSTQSRNTYAVEQNHELHPEVGQDLKK